MLDSCIKCHMAVLLGSGCSQSLRGILFISMMTAFVKFQYETVNVSVENKKGLTPRNSAISDRSPFAFELYPCCRPRPSLTPPGAGQSSAKLHTLMGAPCGEQPESSKESRSYAESRRSRAKGPNMVSLLLVLSKNRASKTKHIVQQVSCPSSNRLKMAVPKSILRFP